MNNEVCYDFVANCHDYRFSELQRWCLGVTELEFRVLECESGWYLGFQSMMLASSFYDVLSLCSFDSFVL
jgi:hypothetical protein